MAERAFWSMRTMSELAPQDVFGKVLIELAQQDERIVALCPDVMVSTRLKYFAQEFPNRFWNTGLTEQATVGMAAGMATYGLMPFVGTFAIFAVMRACEQIRTDVDYPRLNVKIVGTHAGLSTGKAGTTHHVTEDIAIMRSMANMTVLVPSDTVQTVSVFRQAAAHDGPCYVRLIRGVESPLMIYDDPETCPFEIGKATTIKDGNDITIVAAGSPAVQNSFIAANELDKEGIHVRVIDLASVKPIDTETIVRAAEETAGIVTVEDHNIVGGIGGAVAEVISEERPTFLKRVGMPDIYSAIGPEQQLWTRYGLDPVSLGRTVREFLEKVG